MRPSRALSTALGTVLAIGALLAAGAPSEASAFKADDLHSCVGYTDDDLYPLPLSWSCRSVACGSTRMITKQAGARLLLEDPVSGHALLLLDQRGPLPPAVSARNVESLRLVVAPECALIVEMSDTHFKRHVTRRLRYPSFGEPTWRRAEIGERNDDRMTRVLLTVGCWDSGV